MRLHMACSHAAGKARLGGGGAGGTRGRPARLRAGRASTVGPVRLSQRAARVLPWDSPLSSRAGGRGGVGGRWRTGRLPGARAASGLFGFSPTAAAAAASAGQKGLRAGQRGRRRRRRRRRQSAGSSAASCSKLAIAGSPCSAEDADKISLQLDFTRVTYCTWR